MKESIYVLWFSVCLILTQTPDGNDAVNILESAQLLVLYLFKILISFRLLDSYQNGEYLVKFF